MSFSDFVGGPVHILEWSSSTIVPGLLAVNHVLPPSSLISIRGICVVPPGCPRTQKIRPVSRSTVVLLSTGVIRGGLSGFLGRKALQVAPSSVERTPPIGKPDAPNCGSKTRAPLLL